MTGDVLARWNLLWRQLNGRANEGDPGVRDVDAPCEYFKPRDLPSDDVPRVNECWGDGHYLCRQCTQRTDPPETHAP